MFEKQLNRYFGTSMLVLLSITIPATAEEDAAYKDRDLPIDRRVEDLLGRMTLEEKVHQLATQFPNANVRLGIPHIKSAEALHGLTLKHATSFPQATAMGSTWDPEIIEMMGAVVAKESRALGVHQVYSPTLCVLIDPRWGRSEECYGEDPYLVSRIGVGYIKGLQGVGPEQLDENHVIATAKHFVADGEPIAGLNASNIEVSERRLHEVFLAPFKAAVQDAGLASVMAAHNAVNGVPMHANVELLWSLLREEWNFDGHVIADNNDIRRLHEVMYVAEDWTDAARKALQAGVDQDLAIQVPWIDRLYGAGLVEAVASDALPLELIDRSTRHVLRAKFRLGLFDDGAPIFKWQDYQAGGDEGVGPIDGYPQYKEIPNTSAVRGIDEWLNEYFNFVHRLGVPRPGWENVLADSASDRLALDVARKAIILLKNEGDLLPLAPHSLKRVAVIGPNADAELLGGYSTPEARYFVSVLEGVSRFLGEGVDIDYIEGCSITDYADGRLDYSRQNIAEAVAAAKAADVVILAIGGNELTAKENEDSHDITLPGLQLALAQAVVETGTPVVAVLLHGRPLAIPWLAENVPAILDSWYLGQNTGTVVAETLFGVNNPGGKLTFSIPRSVGHIPVVYNHLPVRAPRYRDSVVGPLFPFGHGLSYTAFEYSDLVISPSSKHQARVSLTVKNIGTVAGDEVVQLYVHDQYASVVRPVKELKRFRRISLSPGESETVEFQLDDDALEFYEAATKKWIVEPGVFDIWIGSSSRDIRLEGMLTVE